MVTRNLGISNYISSFWGLVVEVTRKTKLLVTDVDGQ